MYEVGEEEIEAIARILRSKKLFRYQNGPNGEDPQTLQLEREIAGKIGCEHALAVTSGTASLICALVGLNIGPEDEVILPGYTFVATAAAVLAVGATPVLADVDASLTLDPLDVERKITPRTKAIIPVHMVGHVADLASILKIARKHRLKVLEDCCQCVGGSYRGRRVGSHGDAGAFSFNFFKNITSGEGGAVLTSDRTVFDRARIYHDVGIAFREESKENSVAPFSGINYRMEEIRAAMLRVQFERLDGILGALRERYRRLRDLLDGASGVECAPVNDLDGVCGTALFLRTPSRAASQAFAQAATERGLGVMLPLDTGKHVYCNWESLMLRRGAHHPGIDPLHCTEAGRRQQYSPDMLPQTLENLARTVSIHINHRWKPEEVEQAAQSIAACARVACGQDAAVAAR